MKIQAIRGPLGLYVNWIKKHKVKTLLIALFLMWAFLLIYNAWPKNIAYSYSGESCKEQIVLLPNIHSTNNRDLNYEYKNKKSIFGKDIIATKICFKLAHLVDENKTVNIRMHPLDMTLLGQNYRVKIPSYPSINTNQVNLEALPLSRQITFPLDKKDQHFEYKLTINNATVNCLPEDVSIKCEIKNLGLKHSTDYKADIDRYFNEQFKNVAVLDIKTVAPIKVTNSSVKNNQNIITKLESIIITSDRDIAKIDGLSLTSGSITYDVDYKINQKELKVLLPKDLPRSNDYGLEIKQIYGTNNETLPEPYKINFRLESGPSVAGTSLNDRATDYGANIIVHFTQSLADANYKSLISLRQNNSKIDFSVNRSGHKLVINPTNNFSKCAAINIRVSGNINNIYGISNNVGWSYSSRAKCASSFNIGKSVQGRNIIGYSYGNGAKEVLYIGALHGDEYNSKRILEEWMWELEGNPGKIPSGTKVSVIPVLNPDGIAKRSRNNVNNVDLNRNFPANNWKSDIVIQGGSKLEGGGGSEPLSEPESSAVASYIQSRRPSLVLTYHSQGGIVESNEAGIANSKTNQYANISGYGYKLASQNTGFFKYDVNGSLEEWAKDKLGQPVILVELSTRVYHDFSRNRAAMWAML